MSIGRRPAIDLQRPTPEVLLRAYRLGFFPMADPITGALEWFSPDPRGIIPLDAFHVTRSLQRELRRDRFDIRTDTAFARVIEQCAVSRSPLNPSWISEQLIELYTQLHRMGHVHSVEAWLGDQLVGGLYGVHIGAAFFGESMFSRPVMGGSNSSKVCLVHLVRRMKDRGFQLLDVQFTNQHLAQFGCIGIAREEYLSMLGSAIDRPVEW